MFALSAGKARLSLGNFMEKPTSLVRMVIEVLFILPDKLLKKYYQSRTV